MQYWDLELEYNTVDIARLLTNKYIHIYYTYIQTDRHTHMHTGLSTLVLLVSLDLNWAWKSEYDVPNCMSCHKTTVVINGRTQCFHDFQYNRFISFLQDLSIFSDMDRLWRVTYGTMYSWMVCLNRPYIFGCLPQILLIHSWIHRPICNSPHKFVNPFIVSNLGNLTFPRNSPGRSAVH